MASTIKLKNGSGAPTSGQLVQGEPALDLTNKRLYTENASGTVIEVGTNPSSLTIGGTALTATAAELNTLDGITATTAELNTLDGITATVTELNYTDGVTSNIQTQLNTKAPIASPTFTGTVTAPAVNVNGTVTADGLNLDGSIQGDNGQNMQVSAGEGAGDKLDLRAGDDVRIYVGGSTAHKLAANFSNNGDLSLFEDTGTTAKFFWDASAESLGIGTSSPSSPLHINNASSSACRLYLQNTGNTSAGYTQIYSQNDDLVFRASSNAEDMRISNGNVGIGTSTIGTNDRLIVKTAVDNAVDQGLVIQRSANSDEGYINYNGGAFQFRATDGDPLAFGQVSNERMRIDSSGNVGIGTSSPSSDLHISGGNTSFRMDSSTNDYFLINSDAAVTTLSARNTAAGSGELAFSTTSAGVTSEAIRIDSSGNLLVGKTAGSVSTAGHDLYADGLAYHVRNGGICSVLNRLTSDGDIAVFRKDGTTVGSIGSRSSGANLYITFRTETGGDGCGLTGSSASDGAIIPSDGNGAAADDHIDLGATGTRFDDIYATNGTIQTSDRNEKQDIEALSDAEQRVAVAAKGLLRKFRWKSSVADKGDEARIHFGIVAQDLQDAFATEGLDAGRYGMFISTTWTDEETGEERTRMGVRYSELLAFIIAAI